MSFGFGFGFPRRLTSGGGLSPSLYLDFVGTGSLPSTVTFSRGTNATLTDSNGRVAWAPHNLLTNSEDFEAAAWNKFRSAATANAAVAPDGTTTADKVVPSAGLTQGGLYNATGVTTAVGTTYTASVYVKAAELGFAFVAVNVTASYVAAVCVNLSTGAQSNAGASGTYAVTNVGNGWWRVTCTAAATVATGYLEVFPLAAAGTQASYTGDGTSGIFIWGAQLNVANAPVNLLTWSEQINGGVGTWFNNNSPTVTTNNLDPNGTNTASKIVVNGTAVNQGVYVNVTAIPAGQSGLFSVWLRGELGGEIVQIGDAGSRQNVTLTTSWQRFSNPSHVLTSTFHVIYAKDNTAMTFYAWGAQLNTGSTALPYVATTSSIYLPPAYNSTTPKNLLGFTQEPENAAWTKSNSYVQQNLLTWSQDFDNAAWTLNNPGTRTANTDVAPDGTTTADTVTDNITTNFTSVRQTVTVANNNQQYTCSAYFKKTTSASSFPGFSLSLTGGTLKYASGALNTTTGVATARTGEVPDFITVTDAGTYWRVQWGITNNTSGNTSLIVDLIPAVNTDASATWAATTTGSTVIWGAQLVQGSTAGDYTQTTSAAAPTRYLNWDGTLTGRKLVEDAAASVAHGVFQLPVAGSTVANTFSVYAKADTRSWIALRVDGVNTFFNISTGVVGTLGSGCTAAITSAGNGWYRCVVTKTWSANQNCWIRLATGDGVDTYTGDGTSGIYVSDFQLSNSASVDPYVYNPQAAAASAAYYGPRFDYNPTGTPVLSGVELVTNGTFDSGTTTGWTADANAGGTPVATLSVVSGRLRVACGVGGGRTGFATQSFTTIPGRLYQYRATGYTGTASFSLRAGSTIRGFDYVDVSPTTGVPYSAIFTATTTTTYLSLVEGSLVEGQYAEFDNISVQEVTGYTATANGLLIEEQRTNLLTYSEQFDNVVWTKTSATVTANAGTAPDGTQTADLMYPSTSGLYRGVYQQAGVSAAIYTDSFYVKASGKSWVQVIGLNGSGNTGVWFNIVNGTVGTQKAGYAGAITPAGNGWYRVAVTHPSQANPFVTINVVDGDNVETVTASGTDGVLLWGAQLEAGSFATSYIPTVASQVTRNADSASMLGDNFYTWYNPNQGTLSAEISRPTLAGNDSVFVALNDGTANNTYEMYKNATGGINFQLYMAALGVTQATNIVSNVFAANATVKAAGVYKVNDVITAASGTLSTADTSATVPVVTQLSIGSRANSLPWNGWIRRIGYYNTRLPDSTLQALTV